MKKILQPHRAEIEKIKGSRFIADIIPVPNLVEGMSELERIRMEMKGASHVCYAIRIHPDLFRFSDDGEPRNSAGLPIFQRLDSLDLVFSLCTVTRFYGGVKLGVGGLVRAYGKAASAVLAECRTEETVFREELSFLYDYADTATISSFLSGYSDLDTRHRYLDSVTTTISIEPHQKEKFVQLLNERTSGRITIVSDD